MQSVLTAPTVPTMGIASPVVESLRVGTVTDDMVNNRFETTLLLLVDGAVLSQMMVERGFD